MSLLQTCFIRVEVKKREFISRIDLAIEMVKRGVSVIIGECYNSQELLKLGINKGYFFGKCAQPDVIKKFKTLLELGWVFGAMDEEGLLPINLETLAAVRFSSKSAKTFKEVFFFGYQQKEVFEKIYGLHDSFIVSGNPRIDMWKSNCYGIFDQAKQDIKRKHGNFILIPLNFAAYTNSSYQPPTLNQNLQQSYKEYADKSEFIFDNFCKLAERFANEKGIKVIIRPHPGDDLQTIKKLLLKHGVKSNLVECIVTNDVFPWISAAQILFHNCCTTSLEAGFCGTPVVTYTPSDTSLYSDSRVNNLFPKVNTYEDALSFLDINKNNFYKDFENRVASWKSLSLENSGKTSAFIANKILSKNKFEKFRNIKIPKKNIDFTRLKNEVKAGMASIIGQRQRKVFLNKFPRTSVEEVENIVDYICKYRGYKQKPKINSINSRLFTITPQNV
jgi:surface carbohydrate biosynthesis protein